MEDLERALSVNSLAIPAISLAVGIMLSSSCGMGVKAGIISIIAAMLFYIILLYCSQEPIRAYRLRMLHYVWMSLGFAGIGMICAYVQSSDKLPYGRNCNADSIVGEVVYISESTAGDIILLKADKIKWESGDENSFSKLLINVRCDNADSGVTIGDIIEFQGTIERIKDNPNSFISGYSNMMASKGIYYVCRVFDAKLRIVNHKTSFNSVSYTIRNQLERAIENTHLAKQTQNFLITVLLGDRMYLETSVRDIFADAGVAHVLALSGMHMGIIGGIILFILYPFNFADRYRTRLLITAFILWIYAFITGMAPSTMRACVMVSFATIGIVLERKRYVFNALFAASILILLFFPDSLFDIGFQLSFVCVASLAAFSKHINCIDQRKHPWLYKVVSLLSATIVATVGSWILTAYYFKSFPLAFLPANAVVLPILPLYIILSLIYLLSSAMGLEFKVLEFLIDRIFEHIKCFLEWIGSGNVMEVNITYETLMIWMVGMVLVGCFLNVTRWRPLLYIGITAFSISLVMISMNAEIIPNGSFIITNSRHNITLKIKDGTKELNLNVKRGAVSRLVLGNTSIFAVDCGLPENATSRECDYLIIAGGFKGKIEDILRFVRPSTIVIHPSVRKKKENNYIVEAKQLGIKCHSLRLDRPLRYILPNSVN